MGPRAAFGVVAPAARRVRPEEEDVVGVERAVAAAADVDGVLDEVGRARGAVEGRQRLAPVAVDLEPVRLDLTRREAERREQVAVDAVDAGFGDGDLEDGPARQHALFDVQVRVGRRTSPAQGPHRGRGRRAVGDVQDEAAVAAQRPRGGVVGKEARFDVRHGPPPLQPQPARQGHGPTQLARQRRRVRHARQRDLVGLCGDDAHRRQTSGREVERLREREGQARRDGPCHVREGAAARRVHGGLERGRPGRRHLQPHPVRARFHDADVRVGRRRPLRSRGRRAEGRQREHEGAEEQLRGHR